MRKTHRFAASCLVLVVLWIAVAAGAEERFFDFGTSDDFKAENPVRFPASPVNWWFWASQDPAAFIRYETEAGFWWVTRPRGKDFDNAIASRVLKHRHEGFFDVVPIDGVKSVWVAIRFKDNLLQPTTVWARNRSDWTHLGKLGGAFDHAWKTAIFKVDAAALAPQAGAWRFRISNSDFGDLMGDLPIDWIRVTDQQAAPEDPKPGFWPVPPPSRFADIGRTQAYDVGGKPMFPVGVMIKGARTVTWKQAKEAGCNHVDLQSWEFNWRRGWDVYADERFHDRVRFGFGDWNEACRDAGVSCSVQFFTDSRSYWIEKQYGSEAAMLKALGEVVEFHKKSPANLVWYPKDEADHDDPTWGAPPEFVLQMADTIRKADPDTPILVLFQGWKPRVYDVYRDTFDVAAFDVYPLGATPQRSVTEIADRLDDMKKQLGDTRARWAVVEAHDGEHVRTSGRQLTQSETLIQGYLSVVHEAQGVLYFVDNEGRYIDFSDMPGPWAGVTQFCSEVTGAKEGIEPFLVAPATVVDTDGRQAVVRVWSPDLRTSLRKKGDEYLLIVVNISNAKVERARIWVKGLEAGRTVPVRFENRSVITQAEVIVDDVEPFGRRVYSLGKIAP